LEGELAMKRILISIAMLLAVNYSMQAQFTLKWTSPTDSLLNKG
jgi:hypothetical protein